MITEKIIDKYLDKRFPHKDQIQERENWRKEFQFFANFLNESAESSRNEETIKLQVQATMPSHIDKELAYKYGKCEECEKWYGDCTGH